MDKTPADLEWTRGFSGSRLAVLPPAALARARRMPFGGELFPAHLGRFDRAAGHFVDRPGGSPEHVLLVCFQGEGFVEARRRRHVLSEGMGILLPPGRAHRYGAAEARPWSLVWMHLVGRQAARREAGARVLRVVRHMREHLAEPLTVAELARVAGWAPAHFATVFRRETQATPLIYLTRLRLQRACELLKASDAPLAEIGARVGIADPFYFSRVFARHQGLSPAAYRRMFTGGGA
jgi:AraC-like DNA-binding protein